MDLGLKDKVAVITGGASGLGRATALLAAEQGVNVIIADRDLAALEKTNAELSDVGAESHALELDVRDYAQCEKVMNRVAKRFGRLDCLINCAGVGGPMTFFAETDPEQWQDIVAINLMGVINCCRAASSHMIDRRSGSIVSLASEAGKANEKRMVVYGATKGGVISLTRGLAAELGRYNIRVNAVCPGVTHTPMTSWLDADSEAAASKFYPLGRLGVPKDIAPMIVFLCSDKTAWLTGQAISISGGFGRS